MNGTRQDQAGLEAGVASRCLQAVYNDTRLSRPEGIGIAEDRLVPGLAERGSTLTSDVSRALAFAAFDGSET